jgi:hypothetical protein
MQLVDDEKS